MAASRWTRASAVWLCLVMAAAPCLARMAKPVDGAFFVRLSPETGLVGTGLFGRGTADQHELFHKRAAGLYNLDYSVRHEFKNRDVYLGLSVNVAGAAAGMDSLEDTMELLKSIPGVIEVAPVYEVHIPDHPINETVSKLHSFTAYDENTLFDVPEGPSILDTPLRMGGVDKVHAMGIRGKGVKVGIIDTGIDYRHPALGGGFGPGKKVAGGYAWIDDMGSLRGRPDPLATCFGGAHGTHVAGIVGMNPLEPPEGLPVSGVAPEAEIYMYRIFDCSLYAPGTDYIVAAMLRGVEDKVDMISLSLSVGTPPPTGLGDPLADVVKRVTDAGVAVIVAMANDAGPSPFARNMYTQEFPSTEPSAIGVGSVANADFPLVYPAQDSTGKAIQYASIWPIRNRTLEVVRVPSGCTATSWRTVVGGVTAERLNKTIFAFEVTENCRAPDAANSAGRNLPPFVLGYSAASRNPYAEPYNLPPQSRLGASQFIQLDVDDADKLRAGLAAGAYSLTFPTDPEFTSIPQNVGGRMDYFSSFGPVRLTYDLKPQISAPGGNILATYPLGTLGGYGILSGTSMATPFLAGCYALVKSQFPQASIGEILRMLQTTAKPMPWVFDPEMLSATIQQGAGMVDVYRAITSKTRISPGQLLITDNTKTVYGAANVTIENRDPDKQKTYVISHQGAGFMNQVLDSNEYNQKALYGTARFAAGGGASAAESSSSSSSSSSAATATVVLAPGQATQVALSIVPPEGVAPEKLPVFGGYIRIRDAESGEEFSVPYSGPPYSLYRTSSLARVRPQPDMPGAGTGAGTETGGGTPAADTLPQFVFYYPNGTAAALGDRPLTVNNSMRWIAAARFNLWTTAYRVDVLPADTALEPTHLGFRREGGGGEESAAWRAAATPPRSSFAGGSVPSHGSLRNVTGLLSPTSNYSPSGRGGLEVTGEDRRTVRLGVGDYRVAVGVGRWGGNPAVPEDWETWLSGVIRLVNGPAL